MCLTVAEELGVMVSAPTRLPQGSSLPKELLSGAGSAPATQVRPGDLGRIEVMRWG